MYGSDFDLPGGRMNYRRSVFIILKMKALREEKKTDTAPRYITQGAPSLRSGVGGCHRWVEMR